MAIALSPSVPARRAALLAGAYDVPHEIGEHAVLDQHVALRGVTLVVDRERSPLVRVAAVVDQRDERRCDVLPHLTFEHRRVLEDVVGLESVAARLVEQHAARAALQHNGKAARGSRHGFEQRECALRGAAADIFRSERVEQLEAHRAPRRLVRGLHAGVTGRDAVHREACADAIVVGEETVGVGDEDASPRVGI